MTHANIASLRRTYQAVHAAQRVVGVVQRVRQLVDAVVGLAVAVETHAHGHAAGETQSVVYLYL